MNTTESSPQRKRRPSSLAMMMVLVACTALIFWARRRAEKATVVADLSTTIRMGTPTERLQAILDLQQVPPDEAYAAIPSLIRMLDDPDEELRARTFEALYYAVQGVEDPSKLATLGDRFLPLLTSDDPALRANGAGLVGTLHQFRDTSGKRPLNPASEEILDVLRKLAEDPDAEVRIAAVEAFALGTPNREAMRAVLLRASRDRDKRVRAFAVSHLLEIASESNDAAVAVVRALTDPSPTVYTEAYTILYGNRLPQCSEVVPGLIKALQHRESFEIHDNILQCLARMGPAAVEARAAVETLLPENLLPIYKVEPIRTLGAIAPESAEARAFIPTLLEQLQDTELDDKTRALAAHALSSFVWDPMILKTLRAAANEPGLLVSGTAIQALEAQKSATTGNAGSPAR